MATKKQKETFVNRGRELFNLGRPRSSCTNDSMRLGWDGAKMDREAAYHPTEDEWMELQAIMDGLIRLPGVYEKMEAYLIGRGYDGDDTHGREVMERWRDIAYGKYPPEA